jgi:anti-anti-sigma factor
MSGRLDTNTSIEADAVLNKLIASGSQNILINCENLDYISSSGLRILLVALQKMKKSRGDLKLACLKPIIKEIFHLAGFDRVFILYEAEEDAVRSFGYITLDERERRIMDVVASTLDIEEDRRRTEENLRQSEKLYRAIFENTGTAMAIVEEDLTIFLANSEFEKMVGYAKAELEEVMSLLSFVVRDDIEKVRKFHDLVRKNRDDPPKHYEFRLKDREGNIKTIYMILDMIPGTPRRVYSQIDITELRKIEEDLRYELTRKRDFIIFAAHELRTPVQPLLGYLHLMLEDPSHYGLNANARELLEKCSDNVDQMREIMEQIVKFSGLGYGPEQMLPQFLPQYREMFPRHLLKSRVTLLRCPRDSLIKIDIPEDLTIRTDSEYFYLVIVSLIFNMFRLSDTPATIEISYHDDGKNCYFAIKNAGLVISAEIITSLFKPFYVGDESKLLKKSGFIGLSFPVAKQMAEMLGGDIKVTSQPGTGTIFTLALSKDVK